jgi:hypothetical protein
MPASHAPLSRSPLHPAPGVAREDTLATPFQMEQVRNHAIVADLNAEYESECMYGVGVEYLSKRQAATLISYLRECAQH